MKHIGDAQNRVCPTECPLESGIVSPEAGGVECQGIASPNDDIGKFGCKKY